MVKQTHFLNTNMNITVISSLNDLNNFSIDADFRMNEWMDFIKHF